MGAIHPVELDSMRYFAAADADAAIQAAIDRLAEDLRDDAERGYSDEWLECYGDAFSVECNVILSDANDDKLGRINDARYRHITSWANQEAERRYYQ